jgi:hypothetical protein
MPEKKLWSLGIDVRTKEAPRLVVRLARLKTTVSVSNGGTYREDPSWSQVLLETEWDLEALDEWLWKRSRVDYAGIFEREAA